MYHGIQSKLIKAKSIPLNYRKSNRERERESLLAICFAKSGSDRNGATQAKQTDDYEKERAESVLLVCVCVWCCYILEGRRWTNTLTHRCFSSSPFFMKSINLSFFFFFFLRNPWTYFPIDIHHCHV